MERCHLVGDVVRIFACGVEPAEDFSAQDPMIGIHSFGFSRLGTELGLAAVNRDTASV